MKKQILLLSILILSSFSANANLVRTDANIFGHVINRKTKEHIPYINIVLKNTTIGIATDATGHYALKNLPEGKFMLCAEGIGFKPQEIEVELKRGKSVEINFEIEEDALNLNEVVVTAGRTSQKRTEAPVIVNTISTKMLETTQSVVLGEGLNFCTGLRYENDCQNCGFSQIRMNGMEGPYSQILINSRPIFSGLAGVYGLELIPANMLERIEVVRGGGSVLYGSNAIAGTINLILKDPKVNSFEAGFNTSLIGTGVSGSNGPAADYNATFNATLVTDDHKTGISVFGNMRDRKMFDANEDSFSEIAPMKNTVIGTRIFHRPAYRSKLSLDFFNIREQRKGGNKQDYPDHERDISESVKHDMVAGALTYEQYLRESDLLTVFASGQYLDRDSYYGAKQSLSDYGNTKDKTYNIGVQYKLSINEPSSLIGGVEHTGSHLKDKKLGYPEYSVDENGELVETHVPSTVVSDQSLSTTGAFAQYEIKVDKFKFLAGARVEHYSVDDKQADSDKSGTVFVPRASVMYDISSYLQTRLGFSRGYRAPQIFDEDLHIETSGSRQVINKNDPDLKQENSTSLTLSFDFNKQIGGVNTNILLEGFYNKLHNPFRNEIGEPDENGTVIYTRVNSKDGAVVQGFNFELKLMPSDKLNVTAGFTLQSSKYKTAEETFGEKKFFRTPNTYGFFALDWEFAKNFGVSATGNYTGRMLVPYFGINLAEGAERDAGELRKSKSFFDAGLKFHYDMRISKSVTVEWFAGMKNIFNSYQKDFDKGIDRDPSYIYGPSLPRTAFFGFRIGNLL
ncbi:outer membrane receptor for ferrienterochelin and colicins [Dysgonomonas sp. PFB1-18]|uniref:TonB-dependent receptor n=1 Tax=unclassified Dysgonomonas TaxID=2630389 RepID=UPI002473FCE0|nr:MULTISPECIES: TonB-dependent receptor [unclassified Dysgonomonas]MDH6307382.1 outer membrane receptor for ferrienterochelin and colicins [Dysgonomonas sp. PF1-14]MDH6337300.1 outer membrane receptor for ferrienterochelin and colicins [Dysgonomonas sp. PF1-16]MDH6379224.1 outer membrane receptor for ferrienterochelin and colicins [Dysgonomonas sp. PFB1-18]MDH6396138.1 outer membrane receptor for ferrienterochelin and colicins [Dysgonomonas sp. PF1-23]